MPFTTTPFMDKQRRSRATRQDVGAPFTVTEADLRLFLDLHDHKWIPSNWIISRDGRHHKDLQARLRVMFDKAYLRRHYDPSKDKHLCYALDNKAYELLLERGRIAKIPTLSNKDNAHEILNSLTDLSFEHGINENPELAYLGWSELSIHPNVPARTRLSDAPFVIPLSGTYEKKGQQVRRSLEPDGKPFVIKREAADKQHSACFLKEIDRNTEPVFSNENRQAWNHKLKKYQELIASNICEAHYGFPPHRTFILIVTTNETHMKNIMRLVFQLQIREPSYLCFTTEPDHAFERSYPAPNGTMLTREWLRVGMEPLNIVKQLG